MRARHPHLRASIESIVISNRADAGLEQARAAGITTAVHSHQDWPAREADHALLDMLRAHSCGASLRSCGCSIRAFIEAFPNRILNIHPSLLPAFPGLHAQPQAIDLVDDRSTRCVLGDSRDEHCR
jgi:phosphoribosylglycinamide formyltransferase-1